MPIYLHIFMVCFFCFFTHQAYSINNQSTTIRPIERIIRNYEKHLLRLKEKYDNLNVKKSRIRERSTDSSADARDEVIDDWTKRDEGEIAQSEPAPIALSPFEIPIHEIGLLPEPSTVAPKFPHKRRFKYLTQYVKQRPPPGSKYEITPAEEFISGDTLYGIDKLESTFTTSNLIEQDNSQPITRVDGESRRMKPKDEDSSESVRHEGNVRNERLSRHNYPQLKKEVSRPLRELRRKATNSKKIDQLNGEKLRKQTEKQETYSIVNLFTASMSDDDKFKDESANSSNTQPKEKPMRDSLPIRRLEDSQPLDLKENALSFNSDEESNLPFLTRPDLFNYLSASTQSTYTSATTTKQPITTPNWTPKIVEPTKQSAIDLLMKDSAFVTASPSLVEEELESKSPLPSSQQHHVQSPTKQAEHASTIVNSMEVRELEPADLEGQIDFDKLYRSGGSRQRRPQSNEFYLPEEFDHLQYQENDEDFPIYPRKKYRNQQHRFGFRRKPIRHPFYDDDEDFDYYSKMDFPRKGLRFPARVQRPQAIPLPASLPTEEQELSQLEQYDSVPTLKPKGRYSTLMDGVAGERRYTPPADMPPIPIQQQQVKQEAPSPEDQSQKVSMSQTTPVTPLNRPDLQMSAENCRKVYNYSTLFGVPDPQAWVRKNCAFVQTFVKAPCKDINTFVDSCYRFRSLRI